MIPDLGLAAAVLNILEKILTFFRWLSGLMRHGSGPSLVDDRQWDFEVRPISFEVDTKREMPSVELRFYAINYLRRPLRLTEIKAKLHLSAGPNLERVLLVQEDFIIAAKTTQYVVCQRTLQDAEVKVLGSRSGRETATYTLVSRAKSGRREHQFGPVAGKWIDGWIIGK